MPETPTILAFDTSAAHCAAALLSGGRIVADAREEMSRGQVERLVPMLNDVLDRQGVGWQDLDAVAVGTGPGNFTGIRIAVSTARGLALGLGIPAIGVTGFEAMRGPDGLTDPVPQLVSLPSTRRGYRAVLQLYADCLAVGSAVEINDYDRPVATDTDRDAMPALRPETIVVGVDATALASALSPRPDPLPSVERTIEHPHISVALVAAAKLAMGTHRPRPAPLYIRPPDAAPARAVPPVL